MDLRVRGEASGSWECSITEEPAEDNSVAFPWGDREYTSPKKFPEDMSARNTRAAPAFDDVLTLFMISEIPILYCIPLNLHNYCTLIDNDD